MTRADLLAYLLKTHSRSPELLDGTFGDEWTEPMHSLLELGLINTYDNRDGVTVFQVVGWKGRGLTPDHNRSTREVVA